MRMFKIISLIFAQKKAPFFGAFVYIQSAIFEMLTSARP